MNKKLIMTNCVIEGNIVKSKDAIIKCLLLLIPGLIAETTASQPSVPG